MISRLGEPSLLVLSALAGGPLHGYGLLGAVRELSGGEVTLRVGSLYGAPWSAWARRASSRSSARRSSTPGCAATTG